MGVNDLTNQVVLITGAGGLGIGRGMVESVLDAGATVVGVDLSDDAAGRLSEAYPLSVSSIFGPSGTAETGPTRRLGVRP